MFIGLALGSLGFQVFLFFDLFLFFAGVESQETFRERQESFPTYLRHTWSVLDSESFPLRALRALFSSLSESTVAKQSNLPNSGGFFSLEALKIYVVSVSIHFPRIFSMYPI